MRAGRVRITDKLLQPLFPPGTMIISAKDTDILGVFELTVIHPLLPEVQEGQNPPLVSPVMTKDRQVWGNEEKME